MSIFFTLFSGALSSVFYGLVITAFVMATLYFLLSVASKGAVKSIPFYISFILLFFFLWANMSVMVGAFQVKSETETMKIWLQQQLTEFSGLVDGEDSQIIGDALDEHFPILGHYLNLFDFSGHDFEEIPVVMTDAINKTMTGQIWKNILWSLGFILAASLISLYFDKGENYGTNRPVRTAYQRNYNKTLNRPRHGKPHFNRSRRNRL